MVTAGSLLAQTTNIGNFSRDRFSAVPEVSAKLGYQVTPNIRAFVGYDLMCWTVIIRPGDAIDTTFQSNSIPSRRICRSGSPCAAIRHLEFLGSRRQHWREGNLLTRSEVRRRYDRERRPM